MKIKSLRFISILLIGLFLSTNALHAQDKLPVRHSCMRKSNALLQQDPTLKKERERIHEEIMERASRVHKSKEEILTIPVVFHVIHDGDEIGEGKNIGEDRILAQLQQLNDDFRKQNSDRFDVPSEFADLHDDIKIEFCLAVRDPDGNETNGITRHNYPNEIWEDDDLWDFERIVMKETFWDTDEYLNIWSADVLVYGYYGWAYPPGGGKEHLDGIVCEYTTFGSFEDPYPTDRHLEGDGRTATHEVGHYLDLEHTFGPKERCNSDDGINDTPAQKEPHFDCPSMGEETTTCGSQDMFMNYMDYAECVIMFTTGQKNVMRATLTGVRSALLYSLGCTPPRDCDEISYHATFEKDNKWGIWNDGGDDSKRYSDNNSIGWGPRESNVLSGKHSIQLRANSGMASSIYTDNLNLNTNTSVTIGFIYKTKEFNKKDKFHIEISTDGGTTFTKWKTYKRTANDERCTARETIEAGDWDFSSNTVFRIRCAIKSGSQDRKVYVDNINLSFCINPPAASEDSSHELALLNTHEYSYSEINRAPSLENRSHTIERKDKLISDANDICKVYPIPAINDIRIELREAISGLTEIELFDLNGTLLKSKVINAGKRIEEMDLINLDSGLYIVKIRQGHTVEVKKVLVAK